jgi:hypothetical protein
LPTLPFVSNPAPRFERPRERALSLGENGKAVEHPGSGRAGAPAIQIDVQEQLLARG